MDLRIRARVHARRQLAADGLGELFDQFRESLYEYDPLRLGKGGLAKDEYGSPVATIIPRLKECRTPEQLEYVIQDEMQKHYPAADLTNVDWSKVSREWWGKWLNADNACRRKMQLRRGTD